MSTAKAAAERSTDQGALAVTAADIGTEELLDFGGLQALPRIFHQYIGQRDGLATHRIHHFTLHRDQLRAAQEGDDRDQGRVAPHRVAEHQRLEHDPAY